MCSVVECWDVFSCWVWECVQFLSVGIFSVVECGMCSVLECGDVFSSGVWGCVQFLSVGMCSVVECGDVFCC